MRQKFQATHLVSGLIRALDRWNEKKIYGAMRPDKLREARRLLRLTQKMAKELSNVSAYRQPGYASGPMRA